MFRHAIGMVLIAALVAFGSLCMLGCGPSSATGPPVAKVSKALYTPQVARSAPTIQSVIVTDRLQMVQTPTKKQLHIGLPIAYAVYTEPAQPRLDHLIRLGKVPLSAARTHPYGYTGVDQRAREKI